MKPNGFASAAGQIAQRIKKADATIEQLTGRVRELTITTATQARQINALRNQIQKARSERKGEA